MKFILFILLFVLISNNQNDLSSNKAQNKENEFHEKFYDCIINSAELTSSLKTTLEENKMKLVKKNKPLRIGRILPKFKDLSEKDQKIIIECKKTIFDIDNEMKQTKK